MGLLSLIGKRLFPPSPYNRENIDSKYSSLPVSKVTLFVIWESLENFQEKAFQDTFRKNILSITPGKEASCRVWIRDPEIKGFMFSDKRRSISGLSENMVITGLIRTNSQNESEIQDLSGFLRERFGRVACYLAEHCVPLEHKNKLVSGEQSPGLVSVSFFGRKPGLSTSQFHDYWFNSHTPFAIDIHPLWRYERNAIFRCLNKDEPEIEGVVPLHVLEDRNLNFSRFFTASGGSALKNALRIQSDVNNFIDLKNIQTVPMREFVL